MFSLDVNSFNYSIHKLEFLKLPNFPKIPRSTITFYCSLKGIMSEISNVYYFNFTTNSIFSLNLDIIPVLFELFCRLPD